MSVMTFNSDTSTIPGAKPSHLAVMLASFALPAYSTTSHPSPSEIRYEVTSTIPFHALVEAVDLAPINATTKECVLEIKRLSGLTWDELGKVFGVSRRSVHNWAMGERLTAENSSKVRQVLANIRRLFQVSSSQTVSLLRGMHGSQMFLDALVSLQPKDLETYPPSSPIPVRVDADGGRLMANWEIAPPFDRIEGTSVPNHGPLKDMKPLAVRVPKVALRLKAG